MQQKILMCAPEYFGINYVINPWMEGQLGAAAQNVAATQWQALYDGLAQHAEIVLVPPRQNLPDMCFTANAGMVIGDTAIVSRFHEEERQGEEPFFQSWFKDNGFKIADWPQDISFEGAGDALLDRTRPIVWMGHGFRTRGKAAPVISKIYNCEVIKLQLVDARFYHLDTCFCPLANGYTLYYPPAFSPGSQLLIEENIPAEKRIVVSEEDALAFACNALDLDDTVFLNKASAGLQKKLSHAGFKTFTAPLSEFMKAGGAAKCLTLKLHEKL